MSWASEQLKRARACDRLVSSCSKLQKGLYGCELKIWRLTYDPGFSVVIWALIAGRVGQEVVGREI